MYQGGLFWRPAKSAAGNAGLAAVACRRAGAFCRLGPRVSTACGGWGRRGGHILRRHSALPSQDAPQQPETASPALPASSPIRPAGRPSAHAGGPFARGASHCPRSPGASCFGPRMGCRDVHLCRRRPHPPSLATPLPRAPQPGPPPGARCAANPPGPGTSSLGLAAGPAFSAADSPGAPASSRGPASAPRAAGHSALPSAAPGRPRPGPFRIPCATAARPGPRQLVPVILRYP